MGSMEIPEELFKEAKNFLDITWEDEASDRKLTGQIERGIAYISAKTGVHAEGFGTEPRAKELLFNYLLYDRAGSLHQFKINYRSDLIGLRARTEVRNATNAKS